MNKLKLKTLNKILAISVSALIILGFGVTAVVTEVRDRGDK